MQIKSQLGKLKLKSPLREVVESQCKTNGLEVLPVDLEHVLALDALPAPHKDPFDRLLIAQANAENAILLSKDPVFEQYPVRTMW
jgi:PIN domain nuclease of toxin-antitoxin system